MPLPERGTPERITAEERIEERLRNLAYFASSKLGGDSSRFHILFHNEATGDKVAAFACSRQRERQSTEITWESQGILPAEETVREAVDILLKTNPRTPMICDESVLDSLRGDSLQTIGEGHFRLTGHHNGDLEIYTPVTVSVS